MSQPQTNYFMHFIVFVIVTVFFTWLLLPTLSFAQSSSVVMAAPAVPLKGKITASMGWAKPSLKGLNVGSAYITLQNTGAQMAVLVAAQAPDISDRVEIHTHDMNDKGMMQMREVKRVEVLPHSTQSFEPGGYHLMLFDLKKPLVEGESFTLTLRFNEADPQEINVLVAANEPEAVQADTHEHSH